MRCARPSATRDAPSCWCRSHVPRPSSRCVDSVSNPSPTSARVGNAGCLLWPSAPWPGKPPARKSRPRVDRRQARSTAAEPRRHPRNRSRASREPPLPRAVHRPDPMVPTVPVAGAKPPRVTRGGRPVMGVPGRDEPRPIRCRGARYRDGGPPLRGSYAVDTVAVDTGNPRSRCDQSGRTPSPVHESARARRHGCTPG